MTKTSRPVGRFFSVLISIAVAFVLPRAVAAGEAGLNPPPASLPGRAALHAATTMWDSTGFVTRRAVSPALTMMMDGTTGPAVTQIADIVYRADGSPAQGTITIVWPAFTTAAGQAVAAGELSVDLGPDGTFRAGLVPNTGATPGTYYRAVFHLNDGTTETEYWMVPATTTTTISAIRTKLVPTSVAAQFLTRGFADTNYVQLNGNETVNGVLTFASSPNVPAPQNPMDAANKIYVDTQVATGTNAGAVKTAPTTSQSILQPTGTTLSLNYGAVQKLNNVRYADQFAGADAAARIKAAIADLPAAGGTVDARGFEGAQTFMAPVVVNKPVLLLLGAVNITNAAFQVSAALVMHSNNRAAAMLTAPSGGTMFTLSGTVPQFMVEGFTLNGAGSGSQLYLTPDFQQGINNFAGGRYTFDNDVIQYFGAHGVPAITMGVSNSMVSVTRTIFQYNYDCILAKDLSELVFYDNNVWYQQDGPCLDLAGRARVFYNDFEVNGMGSSQPDILVSPAEIDCGYKSVNNVVHMFHAVSLATAVDSAKVLAFSYQDFRPGLEINEKASANLFAIVEDGLDRSDANIEFAMTTLDRYGIDTAPLSQMPQIAERARLELRL